MVSNRNQKGAGQVAGPAARPEQDVLDAINELDDTVTDLTAEEAREVTDRIKRGVADVWALIEKAYTRRAWVALGYQNWDAYAMAELDTPKMRIPREDRAEILTSLRQAGMSIRGIAGATGLGVGTVHGAVRDEASVQDGTVVGLDGRRRAATRPDSRGSADRALHVETDASDGEAHRDAARRRRRRSPTVCDLGPAPADTYEREQINHPPRAPRPRRTPWERTVAAMRGPEGEGNRGYVPVGTVCRLLVEETGEPSREMAAALATAIIAKWGSWEAFEADRAPKAPRRRRASAS